MTGNVLFIVADDLNGWIGALGRHPDVQTPNIDLLARRGTLFTHAYCAAPYCNASRMSVFTGCLPTTTGVYADEPFWDLPGRRRTFVEVLRESGYYTFGAGKVFHGVFDYALPAGRPLPQAPWRDVENRPFLWDDFRSNTVEPLPDDRPLNRMFDFSQPASVPPMYLHFDWGSLPDDRTGHMPDAAVSRAVCDFLAHPPREPFFCAAGLYKPHLPWHAPRRFFDLYDPATVALPPVKSDDLEDVPPIARAWATSPPDHDLVTRHGQWREAVRAYLACISYCDDVVGQILEALRSSPAAADTTVVFWGDNGFHLGEKLHWRKFVLWEEATRVPLVIMRPGCLPRRVDDPVSLIDIFPTILGLCVIRHDGPVDGSSLATCVMGGQGPNRPHAIMTWGRGNHSVRTSRWRLTRYADGTEELYDHAADPYEWSNLTGATHVLAVADDLRRLLPPD